MTIEQRIAKLEERIKELNETVSVLCESVAQLEAERAVDPGQITVVPNPFERDGE